MMPRTAARSACVVTALTLPGLVLATSAAAVPTAPRAQSATVSVLHAIPSGWGVDTVDVYADGRMLAEDLTAGQLSTVRLPGGTYDVTVVRDGAAPSQALLRAARTRVPSGANLTVTAHLTTAGRPSLTVFTNNTTTVGMGMGRLTVRHVADTPAVDVRAGSTSVARALPSNGQSSVGLMAGTYPVSVRLTGSRAEIIRPTDVTIRNEPGRQDMGTTTIVYLWGSAGDGGLRRTVQNVPIDLR